MTLILSYACPKFALQVSDRLVSDSRGPFEPLSNKSIVSWFPNAIVSISYSGLAYINARPTDQWIAERLMGGTLDRDAESQHFDQALNHLDIGQALRELGHQMVTAIAPSDRTHVPQLAICGWQQSHRRRRIWPILGTLRYSKSARRYDWQEEPRYWYYQREVAGHVPFRLLAVPPGYLNHNELNDVRHDLAGRGPDQVEDILLQTIRRVASKAGVHRVGKDCLSVLLRHPRERSICIRYLPLTPTIRAWTSDAGTQMEHTAFSPWLLEPAWFYPQAEFMGGTVDTHIREFRVTLESPERVPATGMIAGYRLQPRRPYP
jgi:hypothetical protein